MSKLKLWNPKNPSTGTAIVAALAGAVAAAVGVKLYFHYRKSGY